MKTCTLCNTIKEINEFNKKTSYHDGLSPWCKECKRKKDKENYKKNKEKQLKKASDYYLNNKEEILNKRKDNSDYKEYNKNWKKENKEYVKEYNRVYKQTYKPKRNELRNEKKETEPLFRLIENLRIRNNKVLKNKDLDKGDNHFLDFLGCTKEEFQQHLEKKFTDGMNWDNYGSFWSIDHTIPISIGQTTKDIYNLNRYTNLKPMINDQNFSKNDKFDNSISWQKQIRDQLLDDDIKKGFPLVEKASEFKLNYEQFTIEHKRFIERYEWLGTCGFGVRYAFTARYNGLLGGVVLVAEPNAYQFDIKYEALIQRGACASWTPKNLGSRLVMFSCRWMVDNTDKRIFTAYSDPEAGEIGTIYQACNFDYLGNNFGSKYQYKLENGKLVGDRYFTRTSSMKKWAKELNIQWKNEWLTEGGFQKRSSIPEDIKKQLDLYAKKQYEFLPKIKKEPKGKYVLLLKKHKKENIIKTWINLPYPKRNSISLYQ